MKTKKCCYMERDCTPSCVAYSASSELSEGVKEMGMNDMHCMRLILELSVLMNNMASMGSDYFEPEDVI